MVTHIAIIGAYGSAGVAVAERLADEPDLEVTLIDDGDPGGGLCILRGCMPSKEVLSAAEHRFTARHDPRLDSSSVDVDIDSVIETKNEHTANFAAHRRKAVEALASRDNITFLQESAEFVGDRMIRAGEKTLNPDYVVIATGSKPFVPDLPGIEDVAVETSKSVLDGTDFGDSGIVMGFGYVGLELVPYLAEAAGMELTVIEHDKRPLDEADAPFGDELIDYYESNFDVTILTETYERSVERTDDGGVRMYVESGQEEHTIQADQLFAFTGREPAIDSLRLSRTALSPRRGWVEDTMQAANDGRVFVVGDANGREPILHVAKEEGELAAQNILSHREGRPLEDYENTHHHVVFSGAGVLPYARVGHSAKSAAAANIDHVVVTREAESDGVFKTKNVADGLGRLVIDECGEILGWQGLHYHADVMAKTMQVAVELGLTVQDIPDRAYHPTTPEILDGLVRAANEELDV